MIMVVSEIMVGKEDKVESRMDEIRCEAEEDLAIECFISNITPVLHFC